MLRFFFVFFLVETPKRKRNIYTIKSKEVCKPIKDGGLGIRDTNDNNLALLAKTCWRCLANEEKLSSKILNVKYYPNKPL